MYEYVSCACSPIERACKPTKRLLALDIFQEIVRQPVIKSALVLQMAACWNYECDGYGG